MNKHSKVYLETSVVSYYTAPVSRELRVAAHQQATQSLWNLLGGLYDPYVSDLVLQEAGRGDPIFAANRLRAISAFPVLDIDDRAQSLSDKLLEANAIPSEFPEDALHISIAAVNAIEFLVTWNFKHINNPFTRMAVRRVIEVVGYDCPEILSPEELLGEE